MCASWSSDCLKRLIEASVVCIVAVCSWQGCWWVVQMPLLICIGWRQTVWTHLMTLWFLPRILYFEICYFFLSTRLLLTPWLWLPFPNLYQVNVYLLCFIEYSCYKIIHIVSILHTAVLEIPSATLLLSSVKLGQNYCQNTKCLVFLWFTV